MYTRMRGKFFICSVVHTGPKLHWRKVVLDFLLFCSLTYYIFTFFKFDYIFSILFVCGCTQASACAEVRGQPEGVALPPYGSQELNSSCQAWW